MGDINAFCKTEKMFLPIREGIGEALEYQLEMAVGRKLKLVRVESVKSVRDEGCQTAPQPVMSSTPDLRERPKEPTVSPEDIVAKKPEVKRLEASTKEEEHVELLTRKNHLKQKLIKPDEGVRYTAILNDLKKWLQGSFGRA